MRSLITSRVFVPARCTLNLGGGSYRYRLACGHEEYRWASQRVKGPKITCKVCTAQETLRTATPLKAPA